MAALAEKSTALGMLSVALNLQRRIASYCDRHPALGWMTIHRTHGLYLPFLHHRGEVIHVGLHLRQTLHAEVILPLSRRMLWQAKYSSSCLFDFILSQSPVSIVFCSAQDLASLGSWPLAAGP